MEDFQCYNEIHCYICNMRTDVTKQVQRKRLPVNIYTNFFHNHVYLKLPAGEKTFRKSKRGIKLTRKASKMKPKTENRSSKYSRIKVQKQPAHLSNTTIH